MTLSLLGTTVKCHDIDISIVCPINWHDCLKTTATIVGSVVLATRASTHNMFVDE